MTITAADITGVVLAGGLGMRMGGVDKGLQPFAGTPLALHALRRLAPQVGNVMLNANRNEAAYSALGARFGAPVQPDDIAGQAGPLAGILTGLAHCGTPYLLSVPCDTPLLPTDLAVRLADALSAAKAEIAIPDAPEPQDDGTIAWRAQPVFCLLSTALRDSLARFVGNGGRKVGEWTSGHHTVRVRFDRPGDAPDAFYNANTLAELQALEQRTA
ncbi:MAG: molybdenum cofactor guanylyltransferase MobA [Pseudomonadota bacterium]